MSVVDLELQLQQLQRKYSKVVAEKEQLEEDYEYLQAHPDVVERETHETITTEIQTQIDELEHQVSSLQGQLSAVQEENDDLNESLVAAQGEVAKVTRDRDSQVHTLRTEVADLQAQLADADARLAAAGQASAAHVSETIMTLETQLAAARAEAAAAASRQDGLVADLRAELASMRSHNTSSAAEVDSLRAEATRLRSKLVAAESECARLGQELEQQAMSLPPPPQDLFEEEEEEVTTERVVVLERELPESTHLQLECDLLRNQVARLQSELQSAASNTVINNTSMTAEFVNEARTLRENTAKVEAELIAVNAELSAVRRRRGDLEAVIDRLKADIEMYKAQVAASRDIQLRQDTQIQQQQDRIHQLQQELGSRPHDGHFPGQLEALQELTRLRAEMQQATMDNVALQAELTKLATNSLQYHQHQQQQIDEIHNKLVVVPQPPAPQPTPPAQPPATTTKVIKKHKLCKISHCGGRGNGRCCSDPCRCGGRSRGGTTTRTTTKTSRSSNNKRHRSTGTGGVLATRTATNTNSKALPGAYFFPARSFEVDAEGDNSVLAATEWLRVSEDGLALLDGAKRTLQAWPLTDVLRFGKDEFVFSFEIGDISRNGAGVYYLQTTYMDNIFGLLDRIILSN
eukprot:m.485735 g.485735  ORF g.485735 m.485735 type:complete len:633 (-) comp23944_c0_seq1:230-2128(-)